MDKMDHKTPAPAAFSVHEFCRAHSISRALFYLLQRRKTGPRVMRVGRRTLITAEAAENWRREMEAATTAGGDAHAGR